MVILRNAVKPVAWNRLADKGWWHCAANVRNRSGHPSFVLFCTATPEHRMGQGFVEWSRCADESALYFLWSGTLAAFWEVCWIVTVSLILYRMSVHSQWSHYGHIGYIRSKIASENAWANVPWSNYPKALVSDKVNWRYDSMILRWKAMNTGSFLLHLHQDALYWEYKYIIYIYIYIYIRYITDLTVSICLWTSEVHTTGTDTKQPLQSYAALTLSASMTFRDYATLGRSRWLQMAPACFGDGVCLVSEMISIPGKTEIVSETAWNSTKQHKT